MQPTQQEFTGIFPKTNKTSSINVTDRDLEIIEFICEMKFASLEDVFEKFFKNNLDGSSAKNDLWARKRLLQLEQSKFLTSHKLHQEKTPYYTATLKGYYALTNLNPEKLICKPVGGLDVRNYAHDKLVLKCRLALETQKKIKSWTSDRKLKTFSDLSGGLSANHIPDGIFESSAGEKIAFELEIARKAKSRYQDKVSKYVSHMRSNETSRKFENVLYVCAKETVKELITKETKVFGKLFRVLSMQEFITEMLRSES